MRVDDFFLRLRAHPADATAVIADDCADGQLDISFAELLDRVEVMARQLRDDKVRVLATRLDNGIDWIVADLAALLGGIVHVPVPHFFSEPQQRHVLAAAGADALMSSSAVADERHPPTVVRIEPALAALPAATAKITFTSGSTGSPKGVCLDAATMLAAADGISSAVADLPIHRHLCALPMSILLENIAGLLAPLLRGAAVVAPSMAAVGLSGSSRFEPGRLDAVMRKTESGSVVLLPQMLRAWTAWLAATATPAPPRLLLAAVGGALVGAETIAAARTAGIPAYEGYGLSEAASVQTLNLPGADRPGSVGRPLPHTRLRIAEDGEIEIGGALFLGYLGDLAASARTATEPPARASGWLRTGDLGAIDADGFLHVSGRKDALLVTAYGRNVSPEWVEATLQSTGSIAQAVVIGSGRPSLGAVLWPTRQDATDGEMAAAVTRANAGLPDYARVGSWVKARHRFDHASGIATANGRPRRQAVVAAYSHELFGTAEPSMPSNQVSFFSRLLESTRLDREALAAIPIIQGCLGGRVSLPSYTAFLEQAFHHVRHTVPLLRACRARLPGRLAWMRTDLDEYIEEEEGHDRWILQDLSACGVEPARVTAARPGFATEVMVAYAYDSIERVNPVCFLGMVHVLEGTSVALALEAADRIQQCLKLPDEAFTYLRSHGILDRQHTAHLAALMNRIDAPGDQAAILHAASMFYRLYGNVFRSLPLPQMQPVGATA